jgi:hypothetical protein
MDQMELAKQIRKDKCMEINGRKYELTSVNIHDATYINGFLGKNKDSLEKEGAALGLMNKDLTPDFAQVQKIMERVWLFDGFSIEKLPKHWDEHPEDYYQFYIFGMLAIASPFLGGVATS